MPTRVTASRMVGREAELDELRAALSAAASGSPSLVLISGESGLGKSRLLDAFAAAARAEGARVLEGECLDGLPYAPLVAVVRGLQRAGDPALDALSPGSRAELARLLPELGPGPEPEDDPGTAQARVFEALLTLLDVLARDAPAVLAIEDVHWADASTRAFLSFLARAAGAERLLAVTTYRPDELHRRHPLRPVLAELERDRRTRTIDLAPLDRGELAAVLGDILGAAPEPARLDRLHDRSEGNPLFAEELLAAELSGCDISSSLRESLLLRIERLSAEAQEVLRLLAVAGRADDPLLEAAGDARGRPLRDALREAVAGHLVTADADGRYGFRHALLREVVYDDLLPGERAALHLSLARALEARPSGAHVAAAVAHHFAAAGDQPAALAAAVRAGRAAETVSAHLEAAAQYERALELWERVPEATARAGLDHAALLVRAGHCHAQGGADARAVALLERAVAELDDPHRTVAALEELARAQWQLGRDAMALLTVDRALAGLPPGDRSSERASLLAWRAKASMLASRHDAAVDGAREALAAAEAAGDPLAAGRARNALGTSRLALGDAGGADDLRAAAQIAREHGSLRDLRSALVNLPDALHVLGRSEEALAAADAGLQELGARGERLVWLELLRAEIEWDLGLDDRSPLPAAEDRRAGTRMYQRMLAGQRALAAGDHETARAALEEAARGDSPEPQFYAPIAAARGELLRREGALDAAAAVLDDALERLTATQDPARISDVARVAVAVAADAAVRHRDLGEAAEAKAAAQRARVLAARLQPGPCAVEARAEIARATGDAAAAEIWRATAEAWAQHPRPHREAAARLREAEAHAAAGDRAAAAAAAAHALERARAIGAGWVAREAEGLATRARLRLDDRPAETDDPFGLTPRERAVLALVAQGCTNREIGATLYMAEKTASVHVSRILAKLDVRSRTEAAAVALRHGLAR